MPKIPVLKPGDSVEIIAPASRCSDQQLSGIKGLLESWQLHCRVDENIFGEDLLCANTDAVRFDALRNALLNPDIKAIICARGGYGSMRLIPELTKLTPPVTPKLFMGMSDITALSLYLQQQWQWPVLHGALALDKISPESIAAVRPILFGEVAQVQFQGLPLNKAAAQDGMITASVTGGNLCMVQTSIGTAWQLDSAKKIVFLEEVSERGYRIDRMLEQLRQANILKQAAAIVFGDFTQGEEPDGSSLVMPVLERFAQSCAIPVVKIEGIGHGHVNFPLPLGTAATMQLGSKVTLTC